MGIDRGKKIRGWRIRLSKTNKCTGDKSIYIGTDSNFWKDAPDYNRNNAHFTPASEFKSFL